MHGDGTMDSDIGSVVRKAGEDTARENRLKLANKIDHDSASTDLWMYVPRAGVCLKKEAEELYEADTQQIRHGSYVVDLESAQIYRGPLD